ncbi:serine dehydratase subunit alpha family protein [Carboxylicivirga caseinilyticus]|uniref:L-cysteine desulfidase family protein n=1 Tax=Carboxylicivirga caseinilyticus TaxID=3417572 RepID=UPI003D343116|nr:serine dehydratase subunit alpha family protein [Marinilabiliaceae bacterium A049]
MNRYDEEYKMYVNILHEELMPAMGCTEPIAIAYAAAMARKVLGQLPDRVVIEASDNIIKNVKSVVVPNTGNLKGIKAAAIAGIIAGEADKVLEVISKVSDSEKQQIKEYLSSNDITVNASKSGKIFDIVVNVYCEDSSASVQISHFHTNIVRIIRNNEVIQYDSICDEVNMTVNTDRSKMSVEGILMFVESVNPDDVSKVLDRQINMNYAIAQEGIKNNWGANVGKVLLNGWGKGIKNRARALAAAGSDARMSGCELPVMIVSGSGNQGMTASVPVIEYAKELKVSQDALYRALLVSNLVTIHQKTGIGRLSAYCGAVSAGIGAGAGIAWLQGGRYKEVAHTIVNGLAIVSGIVCDGAKPSCAGKIASAVEAGILGYEMYKNGHQFYGGDGIVVKGVENTIKNVGRLGSIGMRETDQEIIKMMLEN